MTPGTRSRDEVWTFAHPHPDKETHMMRLHRTKHPVRPQPTAPIEKVHRPGKEPIYEITPGPGPTVPQLAHQELFRIRSGGGRISRVPSGPPSIDWKRCSPSEAKRRILSWEMESGPNWQTLPTTSPNISMFLSQILNPQSSCRDSWSSCSTCRNRLSPLTVPVPFGGEMYTRMRCG